MMRNGDVIQKNIVIMGVVVFVLLLVTLLLPSYILETNKYMRLSDAAEFTGAISQAIGVDDDGKLLVPNTDFILQDTKYYDDDSWVVTKIHNLHDNGDAYIILKKQSGAFVVFMGPGTSFDKAYMVNVPIGITQYLDAKGVIYES